MSKVAIEVNIVQQTSNKLTLHNPALGAWIVGGVLVCAGILIHTFFASKIVHTFSCDRTDANQGSCKIQEINRWVRSKPTILPLNELKEAEVKPHITYDRKGRESITYDVYILTTYENIFFIWDTERQYPDSLVAQINEFVNNSTEPSLKIRTTGDNSLIMSAIGGVLGVVSLFFIFADDITCSFDKSSEIFYIRRHGIRGKRFKSERNSNVSDVRIEESGRWQNKNTGKTHITYKLSLVLKSGESLFLDNGSSRETYQQIANDIRKFVNLKPLY